MNLSCGSRTIKYLIFSFNFFFVITGIILIAVGASIRTYFVEYDYFLNNHYFSLPNLLIATGSLIFFICFLGCYGAIKNSWLMLMLFSVFLGIIFIFEFSAGIAGYVLRDKTTSYLTTSMKDSLPQYSDKFAPAPGLWDLIQTKFECCGVTDMYDWTTAFGNNSLPITCCPKNPGQIESFTCNANEPQPISSSSTATVSPPKQQLANGAADNGALNNVPAQQVSSRALHRQRRAEAGGDSSNNKTSTTPMPILPTMPPYKVGCAKAFGNWVKAHAVDIGAVCFTLAVLQLIGIGFACHLSQQLKKSYYST